jgi:molybdopterin/thiamine biosynthesis adenylyltransferase
MIESFIITDEPEDRYTSHCLIDSLDQNKLEQARIPVVGAFGNEVLKNLALLGIDHIAIIDFDVVSVTNLTRSILFQLVNSVGA